jgi:hypothetical protein
MAAVAGSQLCLGDREGACGGACGRRKRDGRQSRRGRGREKEESLRADLKNKRGMFRAHMSVVDTFVN